MGYSFDRLSKWAYDNTDFLTKQDEGLSLQKAEYIPLLLSFVSDFNCPKSDYIYNILETYIQTLFLSKSIQDILQIKKLLINIELTNYRVAYFYNKFSKLYNFLFNKPKINDKESDTLAYELINGNSGKHKLIRTGNIINEYIEYSGSTESSIIYLYIKKNKLDWIASQDDPLRSITRTDGCAPV